MPTLVIDDRSIAVPTGTKVIEAAECLGIRIPRFCYHPALGAVGACRMCAVQFLAGPVKGVQMSCMVDAQDGMVVSTTDKEAVDFRRQVIEWLMLNHPHDCPVCDEGGHCLLQEMTLSGNHGMRRYQGTKRTYHDQDLGPLLQHEMNRCIHCYRCARYYQEYSGYRDLGVLGIARRVYFGRSASGTLASPFAGNLIDLCPTGVFTDKPSRFMGRRWDFERAPSICMHCSLGCNLTVSARYRQIVRQEARHHPEVNGYFICDRGRYGFAYASHPQRPRQARVAGQPVQVEQAISQARERIARLVAQHGPQAAALVGSVRNTLETLALLAQACTQNQWQGPVCETDAQRAEQVRVLMGRLTPELSISLAGLTELAAGDRVIVLGADPLNEAPMLALSLRQAWRRGAKVTLIDPRPITLPFAFDHLAMDPEPHVLNGLLDGDAHLVMVCGADLVSPSCLAWIAEWALARRSSGVATHLFVTLNGPNALGAGLACAAGSSFEQLLAGMETGRIKALVVVENDLWSVYADRPRLRAALDRLELLVVMDYLASPLNELAGIFIPTQTIYESGGLLVNQEGRVQRAQPVFSGGEPIAITAGGDHPPRRFEQAVPGAEPVPAWRAVAGLVEVGKGIDDQAARVMLDAAMHRVFPTLKPWEPQMRDQRIDLISPGPPPKIGLPAVTDRGAGNPDQLTLLLVESTFGSEPLSLWSQPLQALEPEPLACLHPDEAQRLGVADGGQMTIMTDTAGLVVGVKTDPHVAPGVVVLPRLRRLNWQTVGAGRRVMARSRFGPAATVGLGGGHPTSDRRTTP